MCTVVPSLICAANDSVVIRFPRKNDIFLFQLPVGYESGIEKPKGSGVRNILKFGAYEGRNLVSIRDYYKNNWRGHWART
jgi:hypothetical protein